MRPADDTQDGAEQELRFGETFDELGGRRIATEHEARVRMRREELQAYLDKENAA
jgi:hypothetical protein